MGGWAKLRKVRAIQLHTNNAKLIGRWGGGEPKDIGDISRQTGHYWYTRVRHRGNGFKRIQRVINDVSPLLLSSAWANSAPTGVRGHSYEFRH